MQNQNNIINDEEKEPQFNNNIVDIFDESGATELLDDLSLKAEFINNCKNEDWNAACNLYFILIKMNMRKVLRLLKYAWEKRIKFCKIVKVQFSNGNTLDMIALCFKRSRKLSSEIQKL